MKAPNDRQAIMTAPTPPKPPKTVDHYTLLGVDQTASTSAIKKAFRQLALQHHPDKFAPGQTVDAEEFRQIREAVSVLTDQTSRAKYDFTYAGVQAEWKAYHAACLGWDQDRQECERRGKEQEERRRQEELRMQEELRRQEELRMQEEAREQEREAAALAERLQQEQKNEEYGKEVESLRRQTRAEAGSRIAAEKAQAEQDRAARYRLHQLQMREAAEREWAAAQEAQAQADMTAQAQPDTVLHRCYEEKIYEAAQ